MVIIKSMIDNDFYKYTMGQGVFTKFPDVPVEYEFKLRNYDGSEFRDLVPVIDKEINALCRLRFKPEEIDYLRNLGCFSPGYLDFLSRFQLDRNKIRVFYLDTPDYYGNLHIHIAGSWLETILFEVPVLAIVSELMSNELVREDEGAYRLREKIEYLQETGSDLEFVDFGTRRRFSFQWQKHVLKTLETELSGNYTGTSNVLLSKQMGTPPRGTMAHEWLQAFQGLVHPRDSQRVALETWLDVHHGQHAIALSDCLGMTAFLRDFNPHLANAYVGLRQDSGDPWWWSGKFIEHYKHLGINPKTKTAVFSDGLDFPTATEIHRTFHNKMNVLFGIGTDLTNDMGFKAPQIVIKMTRCNGRPTAKISDSTGKSMCNDETYLKYLKETFQLGGE